MREWWCWSGGAGVVVLQWWCWSDGAGVVVLVWYWSGAVGALPCT